MHKVAKSFIAILIIFLGSNVAYSQETDTRVDQVEATGQPQSISIKQKIRDASITANIKFKYIFDSEVDALSINIDTINQVVYLNGEVEDPYQAGVAENIALMTAGVVKVTNNLTVKMSHLTSPLDND